jgi:hypothetical protein
MNITCAHLFDFGPNFTPHSSIAIINVALNEYLRGDKRTGRMQSRFGESDNQGSFTLQRSEVG